MASFSGSIGWLVLASCRFALYSGYTSSRNSSCPWRRTRRRVGPLRTGLTLAQLSCVMAPAAHPLGP